MEDDRNFGMKMEVHGVKCFTESATCLYYHYVFPQPIMVVGGKSLSEMNLAFSHFLRVLHY